jgi:NAD(P)-dependent dehydrogenase (short-subunit alcohol dehydrogenase family)
MDQEHESLMSHGRFDNPVIAALAGFKDRFREQPLASRLTDADRFDGKRVLITGANSGLGYALAVDVARRGGSVTMACRSEIPEAGQRAIGESGSQNIEMRHCDLSRMETLHGFCRSAAADGLRFDVVILNAATTLPRARPAPCGQDEMIVVNYLANFALVHLLIDHVLLVPDARVQPRIVVISSDSHQGSSAIDYEEFGRYFDYGVRKAIANYSYFKLLLNTFATELSRRLNSGDGIRVQVNVICPGPVNSNIIKAAPWALRLVLRAIFRVIFKSPAEAARPVIYMAASSDFAGRTNDYLHMFSEKPMDSKVYDESAGSRLWRESAELWARIDDKAADALSAIDKPGL